MSTSSQRRSYPLAAFFVGIAGGIVAGTYVLAPNIPDRAPSDDVITPQQLAAAKLDAEIGAAQAQTADAVVESIAAEGVKDSLHDQSVLLVITPGADQEDIDAVQSLLRSADATDAGVVWLKRSFLSQDGADGLKTIVTSTLPAGAQLSVDKGEPGTHAGEALGSALMRDPATGHPQAEVAERTLVLNALKEAGYIDFAAGTILPADAIIVITGDDDGSEDPFTAKTLARFATALDARGRGVVLAGRIHSAADAGAIGLVRADAAAREHVSTVDSLGRAYGRMGAVLAARHELEGSSGAYGAAASADAAVPAPAHGPVPVPAGVAAAEEPPVVEDAPVDTGNEQPVPPADGAAQ